MLRRRRCSRPRLGGRRFSASARSAAYTSSTSPLRDSRLGGRVAPSERRVRPVKLILGLDYPRLAGGTRRDCPEPSHFGAMDIGSEALC